MSASKLCWFSKRQATSDRRPATSDQRPATSDQRQPVVSPPLNPRGRVASSPVGIVASSAVLDPYKVRPPGPPVRLYPHPCKTRPSPSTKGDNANTYSLHSQCPTTATAEGSHRSEKTARRSQPASSTSKFTETEQAPAAFLTQARSGWDSHLGVLSVDSHSARSCFFFAASARISSRLTGTRASPPSRMSKVLELSFTMCMCCQRRSVRPPSPPHGQTSFFRGRSTGTWFVEDNDSTDRRSGVRKTSPLRDPTEPKSHNTRQEQPDALVGGREKNRHHGPKSCTHTALSEPRTANKALGADLSDLLFCFSRISHFSLVVHSLGERFRACHTEERWPRPAWVHVPCLHPVGPLLSASGGRPRGGRGEALHYSHLDHVINVSRDRSLAKESTEHGPREGLPLVVHQARRRVVVEVAHLCEYPCLSSPPLETATKAGPRRLALTRASLSFFCRPGLGGMNLRVLVGGR